MRAVAKARRRAIPYLVLGLALLWGGFPAKAVDAPLQISQYAHTAWSARDGATLGLVFAMAQTPDGYLWIAGSLGLFRFDGLRFAPWEPPPGQGLPAGPYSLLVSRDGTLWIGTFYGLASWDGRNLTRYPETHGMFVTSLLEDHAGTIWAGLRGDPGRLCAVRARQVSCTAPDAGFGAFVWSLGEDAAGNLWVGADSGVWRWSPGVPRRYPMAGLRVGDLSTAADGGVLVGNMLGGISKVAGDQLAPYQFRRAASPDEWIANRDVKANKLLRDRDGGLWIGTTNHGLIHVKDGQADMFAREDGLTGNIACALFEDHEGNIWFGSEKGVDRFRKLAATSVTTRQGLPDEAMKSVLAASDGSIWAATGDGLARWKDGRLMIYKERDGLPDSNVQSQYQDADGRLWVSTARGLAYFSGKRFVAVGGGPSNEIYSMTGDAAGNLWLAGNNGLSHLLHGRFIDNTPWSAFGRTKQAQAIVADQGGLWLSFWDDLGVPFFKNGKIQANYTPAQGLGAIATGTDGLRLDAEGALWVGTDVGLSRIKDGRVSTLAVVNDLPCKHVQWSTLDDNGSLWMYADCGLVRVGRDDLAAWTKDPNRPVPAKVWGGADGVPRVSNREGYFNPAVTKGSDGKLWFLSSAELLRIDPGHMPFNTVAPPVHIESLVADHRTYQAANGLRLPPLVRDIAIEFSALSLVDPHSVRFRYRLEGYDSDWQEAVDRRLATYTNLPAGPYRFQVKASNNSGVWNEAGAQLTFSILPAFYQTAWFRVACVALLIGLAWGTFQVRLRIRITRLQREFDATLEARVAERTRIARDLHDTLLQRFHGLLLQFQAGINLLPDRPRESKQVLLGAVDQVAEAITEGRDTVQGLRASVLESNNLADSLRSLAEDLAQESGLATAARVDVHGTPLALHPLVRDEAFRIAAEALRNAFRHADAKQVDVEIRYDARQLRVRVRDDGKGMDPEVLDAGSKEGHFGLSGMRERAEVVGGVLTVRSRTDAGVEVDLCIPATRAYTRASTSRSWLHRRKVAPGDVGE